MKKLLILLMFVSTCIGLDKPLFAQTNTHYDTVMNSKGIDIIKRIETVEKIATLPVPKENLDESSMRQIIDAIHNHQSVFTRNYSDDLLFISTEKTYEHSYNYQKKVWNEPVLKETVTRYEFFYFMTGLFILSFFISKMMPVDWVWIVGKLFYFCFCAFIASGIFVKTVQYYDDNTYIILKNKLIWNKEVFSWFCYYFMWIIVPTLIGNYWDDLKRLFSKLKKKKNTVEVLG